MAKKQKIVPRGEWVLVEPITDESRETASGLLLPDTEEKEQKAHGIVKAVGEKVNSLKKGDHVIYGAFAGESMKVGEGTAEVDYKLLMDEDIIALIV